MNRTIYTCGYGIIEGTRIEKRDKFVSRLEYIQRGIGKPVTVVDIRKWGSGSRNGPLFSQPKGENSISGMRRLTGLCNDEALTIDYKAESILCNQHGSSLRGLRRYSGHIFTQLSFSDGPNLIREAFMRVKVEALKGERAVLLLCGCKEAFRPNGTTSKCHRVPLADLLVTELGEGWRAVHL